MNVWHDIDIDRIKPEKFLAVIEIPKGSKMKYELDKETGRLLLDRVLYTSTHYPANYGFIPKTLAEDQDPLDVLVLCQEKIEPLCLVECTPIGVVKMNDKNRSDEKIIAVCSKDPSINVYKDIKELPQHTLDEIRHFFSVYKQLEHTPIEMTGEGGHEKAEEIIKKAIKRYRDAFQKKIINI